MGKKTPATFVTPKNSIVFCIISAGNRCILLAIFVIVSYFKPIRKLNSQRNLHCISFFGRLYFEKKFALLLANQN
jgi:hypothetical protein